MEKVGLVIPVLHNFKGAVALLESVKTELSWVPIIIPNWENNVGVAAGWNKGVIEARNQGCTHVLISNDDIVMSWNCIDVMLQGFFEGYSLVTANNMRETQTAESIKSLISLYNGVGFGPDFSCFMIRADLFDDVGTFDENFFPAYFEDNDYHRRMELLGFRAGRSTGALMYHAGSVTQNFFGPENSVCKPAMFEANNHYFIKKWGCTTQMSHNEGYQTPYNEPGMSPKDWRLMPRPA